MLQNIYEKINNGEKAALIMVTKSEGSTPAEVGKTIALYQDETFEGTVGGGRLEHESLKLANECLIREIDKSYKFNLEDDLGMNCGGYVEVFIKVFKPNKILYIIGGGHIGLCLEELGRIMGFSTVVIDNREEIANTERFPHVKELILGNIEEECEKLQLNSSSYVVIVTHGHKHDEEALEAVIDKDSRYLGVIGSKNKVETIYNNLMQKEIERDAVEKVYSPIGLNLGGNSPEEIALSIISEIILVKNNGKLEHMKGMIKK